MHLLILIIQSDVFWWWCMYRSRVCKRHGMVVHIFGEHFRHYSWHLVSSVMRENFVHEDSVIEMEFFQASIIARVYGMVFMPP